MNLAELIQPSRVLCNVEARSKKHALEILSELLAGGESDFGKNQVFESLVSREKLGSTGLGLGVALPHGRFADIGESTGAFLKLSEPIDFDAYDGQPVRLIFGLLVPMECSQEHFSEIERYASVFSDAAFISRLENASSSSELYELLRAEDGGTQQTSIITCS